MTFIYKGKRKFKNVYYKFIKFAIDNKYVDRIIVFSKNECEYYSKLFNMDKNKFVFEKLGINKIDIKEEYNDKNYIISAGRSNRDYDFLIQALKNTDYRLKIVTDIPLKKEGKNIEIFNHISGQKFYAMLKNASCVVIPLKDTNISSGQLVILQAMQLKIPIITTNVKGLSDYIIDGYNRIYYQ